MQASSHRLRSSLIFLSSFLLLISGLSYGAYEDTVRKTFEVGPGGKLTLETDIGSVEVRSTKSNTLEVEVIRKVRTTSQKKVKQILDEFDLSFDQRGNDVSITGELDRHGWKGFWDKLFNDLKVKFVVSVPRIYDLQLATKGGSITIGDLEGEVDARTSGGSIQVGDIEGNVDVHTSGGSIRIERVAGEVDAHTSGGSIKVYEVMGIINAKTSGGSVEAKISRQPESNCRLATSGGSVTVYLANDIAVDVDASTSGGRVHTDFPVTISGKISERSLKASINGGGPELYLHTSGGSIYIRKM